jgi:hypothetical protein
MKTEFYHFDKKTICILTDTNTGEKFYGEANWDGTGEYNERVGEGIAEIRARINGLRTIREANRAAAKTLERALIDMKQSKKYNPKSYEAKWLRRLIWEDNEAVKVINDHIKTEKNSLKYYISVRCK